MLTANIYMITECSQHAQEQRDQDSFPPQALKLTLLCAGKVPETLKQDRFLSLSIKTNTGDSKVCKIVVNKENK